MDALAVARGANDVAAMIVLARQFCRRPVVALSTQPERLNSMPGVSKEIR